jgi:UDP-N-acetylmuramate dehydrogenase
MTNWNVLYDCLRAAAPELELRRDEPMNRHTSFKVGGPAALMALPCSEGEAKAVVKTANELGIQPFFLGNGSNLLVSDRGTDRFVVKLSGRLEWGDVREVNRELVNWGGGSLSRLAAAALDRGLSGLEFAQGIPGSVGGGVYMNAGAYGGEIRQVVSSVTALDVDGTVRDFTAQECGFGYRKSVFSENRMLILKVRFALTQGDRAEIKAKMDDFAARRREKQPLEYPSAGSTFKRPAPVDGQPVYAAALIQQCGLKGLTVGGAQVSEKHAGFVINRGGAACDDIVKLMAQVRERVFQETGITLEPEVRYLGREGEGWNF